MKYVHDKFLSQFLRILLHFILVSLNDNSQRAVQESSHDNSQRAVQETSHDNLAGGIKHRLQVIRFAI